ncbi:hypothetical protein B0H11DRAFT_1924463 [Mycena galericulata]|nr:hypothetical protein B0H11DRAFT_1924463 [Mycena galericulata]
MPDSSKVKTWRPASTMLARRRASAKYREKNEDELRAKARERMSRTMEGYGRRQGRKAVAMNKRGAVRAMRAADIVKKTRARWLIAAACNGWSDAFVQKHGSKAWVERTQKLEAQRREAQEEEEWQAYAEELRRREREREAAESLRSLASVI